EDHSDSTVRFRRNSTRICPRTRPVIRVDPFLDGLNVTHTRNFRQFGRVLTVKLTELHIETSDFSQVLGFHGLDLTRICGTNPVTWPETS
ncbi:sugar transporter, partial [Cutibacterium acnes subsp. acnes]|nr:sugar transporter [Cutibacterium acnes subsp. acnes]